MSLTLRFPIFQPKAPCVLRITRDKKRDTSAPGVFANRSLSAKTDGPFGMRFAAGVAGDCDAPRMRGPEIMLIRRDFVIDREPATRLPLFKFLLVVGTSLTVGLIAIGSSFEPSAAVELSAKKRATASVEAKKP